MECILIFTRALLEQLPFRLFVVTIERGFDPPEWGCDVMIRGFPGSSGISMRRRKASQYLQLSAMNWSMCTRTASHTIQLFCRFTTIASWWCYIDTTEPQLITSSTAERSREHRCHWITGSTPDGGVLHPNKSGVDADCRFQRRQSSCWLNLQHSSKQPGRTAIVAFRP